MYIVQGVSKVMSPQKNEHENMKEIFSCALFYVVATLSFYYGLNATEYRFLQVLKNFRGDLGPCVFKDFLNSLQSRGWRVTSSAFSCKIAQYFRTERSLDCWQATSLWPSSFQHLLLTLSRSQQPYDKYHCHFKQKP